MIKFLLIAFVLVFRGYLGSPVDSERLEILVKDLQLRIESLENVEDDLLNENKDLKKRIQDLEKTKNGPEIGFWSTQALCDWYGSFQ